jgi:hypothetical protein
LTGWRSTMISTSHIYLNCIKGINWPVFRIQILHFPDLGPGEMLRRNLAPVLHGILRWVCDQGRGRAGQRRPGIKYASSLETFWKCYLIVYKLETGRKLDPMIQVNGQDVSLRIPFWGWGLC